MPERQSGGPRLEVSSVRSDIGKELDDIRAQCHHHFIDPDDPVIKSILDLDKELFVCSVCGNDNDAGRSHIGGKFSTSMVGRTWSKNWYQCFKCGAVTMIEIGTEEALKVAVEREKMTRKVSVKYRITEAGRRIAQFFAELKKGE